MSNPKSNQFGGVREPKTKTQTGILETEDIRWELLVYRFCPMLIWLQRVLAHVLVKWFQLLIIRDNIWISWLCTRFDLFSYFCHVGHNMCYSRWCYTQAVNCSNTSCTQITSPTISPISHNAPFCNRNVHVCAHFCYKWCIAGYLFNALWDLWDVSVRANGRNLTKHVTLVAITGTTELVPYYLLNIDTRRFHVRAPDLQMSLCVPG